MTTLDAVDCLGFAGGFTLGTVRAGFRLVGKREHAGGFGVPALEANRHLLGDAWEAQCGEGISWDPVQVPYVFGNPPCSGFSLLSRKGFRGPGSPVNSCMWDFVRYASRCNPEIMVFESVAQAYKQGRELMTMLRADVERMTGQAWHLTHVLHNAYSLGGAAIRRRYFFVCHRIPFGVEPVQLRRVPTLLDAIGDLGGLSLTWEQQPYRRPPTWWSRPRRSSSGVVDGHMNKSTPAWLRARDLLDSVGWAERENIEVVAKRYYEKHGDLPESWRHLGSYQKQMSMAPDFRMGFNQLYRWSGDRAARVITGGALDLTLHPREDRLITHREALRVQGFPDEWVVGSARRASGLHMFWGKGIPVDCGEWISGWVRASILGAPGSVHGEPVADRESTVNLTNDYRVLSNER